MGRAPRRAVAIVLAGLAVLAAGCTVGPSQRPPVAVRGESMPAPPPPPAEPPPPPQSLPEPSARNPTIPFYDCTDDVLPTLPIPVPAGRALRVDCGEIAVPADHEQPGRGRVSLDVLTVGVPGAPRDRPALVVLGDTAGEASALAAVQLAAQVEPALLERYVLVGLDRRGSGADLLECSPLDAQVVDHRRRPRRHRRRRAGLAAGGGPQRGAGVHHHPRRRAGQLPHHRLHRGHRDAAAGARGRTGCPRSASGTGRPRWPAGPGCSRRPSAGWYSTAHRTPPWTSRRSASPGPGPRRPPSTRSRSPAPPSRSARWAPTRGSPSAASWPGCTCGRRPPWTGAG